MRVDVVDGFWGDFAILQGTLHTQDATLAFGMRSRDVVSVSRSAATYDFSVNLRATCLGMFV